jgi:endoglucanase
MKSSIQAKSTKALKASALFLALLALTAAIPAQTPVELHGKLSVKSTQLVDQHGEPIQLRGISLYDVFDYGGFANAECVKWLRDDFGMTLYRPAMYIEHQGSFKGVFIYEHLKRAIDAALEAGVYVLIDWHVHKDGDPNKFKAEAKAFFAEFARLYGDKPNVLWEICNEPNGMGVTWEDKIKPYAEEVIPVIREIAPDSVIIVGTPGYSHNPQMAIGSPLGFENVMYTFHYYCGSHGASERRKAEEAIAAGLPVFVTESGVSTSDQNGGVFPAEAKAYFEWLDRLKLSFTMWSLSNKLESASMVKASAPFEGSWLASDLTESGLLVRRLMRKEARGPVFADGFETGAFIAAGWRRDNAGIAREGAFEGECSATLSGRDSLAKEIDLSAYAEPALTLRYRTEGVTEPGAFRLDWFDGEKWMIGKLLEPSADWATRRFTFPAKMADSSKFVFRIKAAAEDGQKAWVDGIMLEATLK